MRVPWRALFLILAVFSVRLKPVSDASDGRARQTVFPAEMRAAETVLPSVWLVEKTPRLEVYSNGLRVEDRSQSSGCPRAYLPLEPGARNLLSSHWRSEPAGIVFHTTESPLAPLDPGHNDTLRRFGEELLAYVARHRSYHFVVDRFGRVYRMVPESEYANHSGASVWADPRGIYVSLNQSFLGVAFEGQSAGGAERPCLSSAQIHSARVLIQWLRSKYRIAATNCVTHAQVSVNPDNMRIGYHTDGAADFPFRQLGLPDNYEELIPSIYAFGFRYDGQFVRATGGRLWKGLLAAEERLRKEAATQGVAAEQYRKTLQQRYRKTIDALTTRGALEETGQ